MVISTAFKLFAEFLGTFLLMVSMLASGGSPLVVGGTLALIMYLIGGISGAAVNPALSAGLWFNGSMDTNTALLYVLVEVLGAVSGAYVYKVVG
jgi:glycerol uptake facilitator-like aquaporin